MRAIIVSVFIFGLTLLLGLSSLLLDSSAITIESSESKTIELKSVFNQIRFFPGLKRDVWMMNQSHFGRHPSTEAWERLAIVIDKTKKPAVANYYQLKSGSLQWEEDLILQQVPYRASCFICHNNGPRAIRAASESKEASLSLRDRLKIQVWNLRIKTYGRIHYDPELDQRDKVTKVPFSFKDSHDLATLNVPMCIRCHKEEGIFARGALQRQQSGTIETLVAEGQMPPPGFKLSLKERQQLDSFLKGF